MPPGSSRSTTLGSLSDLALRILTARWAFLAFALGLLVLNLLGSLVLRNTIGKDFWEHIAAMRAFSERLWGPPNPYLASATPTHLFTPYHWFWGAVSSVLHVHPLILVPLIGTLNLGLFLVAVGAVAEHIVGDRKWSLLLALAFLLLWWNPWEWSGFYNLGLLPLTASYPYWFALAISLLMVARYPFAHRAWALVSIPVVALVFLVHPITSVFLVLSLALKVGLSKEGSLAQRLGLAVLPATGIGLALLWPYFAVLRAIEAQGEFRRTGFSGNYRIFYQGAVLRLLPALVGLGYVARRLWLRRLDLVSLGTLLFVAIYLVNLWTLRSGPVARLVAFVALFLQLGAVMLVALAVDRGRWRHLALAGALVVLAVAGIGEAWDVRRWVRIEPWTGGTTALDLYARYRPYGRVLDGDDVVLSDPATSWVLAPIVGVKVVAVLHPNPFFPGYSQRLRDVERFVGSGRDLMLRILERYEVTHVLVARQIVGELSPIRDDLTPILEEDGMVLLRYRAG
jgi:hypothetical protein